MANTETLRETRTHLGPSLMDECIRNCRDCERACIALIDHCLPRGGEHAGADHIKLLIDCADACNASVRFMMRGSPYHANYCAACADICIACAEDCARFQDDPVMMACAEVCRRCADSCREMATNL